MNKSFLKWAGGKYDLVEDIRAEMPAVMSINRYIEPFVGGGAVALNMPVGVPKVLNDVNPGVFGVWGQLQVSPEILIANAKGYFRPKYKSEKWFYALRDEYNVGRPDNGHLFLYLNRHCFNGLCRFNKKGEFNVPYGRYKTIYFPEKELLHAAEVVKNAQIHQNDFREVMETATQGDVVYCDPPYIPLDNTSNFTAYSMGGFSMKDHKDLVFEAEYARNRGATVIISNNDTPVARKLYKDADEVKKVLVSKRISCKSDGRKKQGELIAVYRP